MEYLGFLYRIRAMESRILLQVLEKMSTRRSTVRASVPVVLEVVMISKDLAEVSHGA